MHETSRQPARYLRDDDFQRFVPVHVVWEITLACDLKCLHCGSRAGRRRPNELNTDECLEVIESLARLGTREVSLIGGEAYLRKDWIQLIKAIRSHDMYCAIQTGGRNLNPARLAQAVDAGLNGVGVSLDGMAPLHDKVRNVPGSFGKAVDTLKRARAAGLATSVNTQIGALTLPDLPALMDTIIELGATHWQIQLTVAMGNAADNDELLLQPYQLQELMPLLADLYKRGLSHGLLMNVGNNIGYYGPYEHLWRGFGDERVHWTGCSAGQQVIALEADGTVKGCPSLATVGFAGGNVRDLSLEEIWRTSEAIHFGRLRSVDDLWGFCRTCYYADVCRGGCTWTSHSLLGKPGNNPYCHYRVIELQKQGLRERIVKVEEAGAASFAVGRFDLVTERISDGTPVASIVRSGQTIELTWKNKGKRAPEVGRIPTKLALCRNCNGYVHANEQTCPHCSADIEAAARTYEEQAQYRRTLISTLEHLLGQPAG
ncbi:GDL motif peptide-associated radical SAM/SPASM maturase [Paraburkholderia sp. BL21I4N1]|uniref:GDL motif peptide-associated radical SAM/SPASM maturase n=1 Tax=Paraburkholderia sp. BL21I4N1 TaxID=1938801 RepID=UPI000CFCC6E5|nr:GDL motif peptide-associated radical SAM/SPASM maturase [Paraburkholderia sp. BL21I4N1]PQV44876.1 Y-X(10)_GDL-associated radical SAM protein [Paraburkholderia sp. BL21I4N1]